MAVAKAFTGPGTLFLGPTVSATAYTCDLTAGVLSDVSPTYSEVTGCGTVSKMGAADLELRVTVVQDVETATSLHTYSWASHNTVVQFVFIPNKNGATLAGISATVPAWMGQVLVTRLDVGTSSTSIATADGTWKVQGDVTRITTAPAALLAEMAA